MMCRFPLWIAGVCAAALLSLPGIAADVKQTVSASNVDSPSLGYVIRTADADSGALEVRAMLGTPGAARFSDPIALPAGAVAAEVAAGHKWVLVIRSNEAVAFQPAINVATSIARIGAPASWAFSPSGTQVALYYPERGSVLLMSGLPSTPTLGRTLAIAQLDSFAVSDSGSFVYSTGGRILNSDGGLIYQTAGPMAFEAGRELLILFDGANSSLVEAKVAGASTRTIASGLDTPDQLLAGADKAYAANSAAGTISVIDYADGSVVTRTAKITHLSQSALSGTVLVSFDTNDPAWLVNAQGLSFVPAIVPAPSPSQQGIQ